MRTRTKASTNQQVTYSPASYTEFGYPCNGGASFGGTASYSTSAAYTPGLVSETIVDALGRGQSHAVVHRKYSHSASVPGGANSWAFASPAPLGSTVITSDNGRKNHSHAKASYDVFANWSLTNPLVLPPEWVDSTPSVNEESAILGLAEAARQLKADVLLNLVEANQIVPSVQSLANSLPSMARNWNSIRNLIRTASGSFLAWKFGIGPILQDIMNIDQYLKVMPDSIKRHLKQQNRRFSRSFPMVLTCNSSPYANGYSPVAGKPSYKWDWSGGLKGDAEIRYVLVVRPSAKYGSTFFSKADFVTSRFVTSPARLAWEKVPFSFVVDWFVDVRGALNALDKVIGFSPYEIVSFTRSRSYELETNVAITGLSCCNGGVLFSSTSKHQYKSYERSLVSMPGIMPAWRPRFGKNQAAISVALISQALTGLGASRVIKK